MTEAEQFFWERITGMPALEAEQELVLRREGVTTELSALHDDLADAKRRRDGTAESAIGKQLFQLAGSLTLINERIKYLRRVQDSITWRKAVSAVLGADAYEQCSAWVAQHDEAESFRREWNKRKKARQ